ncbi:MAG: AlpA family phage regulatory protein [Brevundimonas sp.]|nr:AlpA family phage regulatory protein [Brevundimonas sp.]
MPEAVTPPSGRLIPWAEVRTRTGLSRTTVWRLQQNGAFPSPVRLSPGRVGWLEGEVAEWTRGLLGQTEVAGEGFEKRPGGRPPARAAGARPSGRQPRRPEPPAEIAETLILTPAPPEAVHEVFEPVQEMSVESGRPTLRRGRRPPPEAPGQLGFDF